MVHLGFLAASLCLAFGGQKLVITFMSRVENLQLRRWLQIFGLLMPVSALALFTSTMLWELLFTDFDHYMDHSAEQERLFALLGVVVFLLPPTLALLFNLLRLFWLYFHTLKRTWSAPLGINSRRKRPTKVLLYPGSSMFAYNLPALWPGMTSWVVLSTGLVEKLEPLEIEAVLRHEEAHLSRRDFWVSWLANWWSNSFFYLPYGRQLLHTLKDDQELACDERVVRNSGFTLRVALAEALLKVWEDRTKAGYSCAPRSAKRWDFFKALAGPFEAPGVAWPFKKDRAQDQRKGQQINKHADHLIEQRVTQLIELGSYQANLLPGKEPLATKLRILSFLASGIGLWVGGLEVIHLVMKPLGCTLLPGLS